MQVTIFDDGFSYDGRTPNERALGSAEKAVVGLSEAMAARGHDVVVVNQITEILEINGVTWLPWDAPRPPSQDLVFAMRKPSLLEEAEAEKCLIWLWGGCKALDNSRNRALLEKHRPALIYVSEAQRLGWKSWRIFPGQVIEPAIARVFLEQEVDDEEPSPLAVTTTHPVHGLRAIIRMWRDNIRPLCSDAELHIYSVILSKAMETSQPDQNIAAVYEDILAAENSGIQVKRPLGDSEMAAVYRRAKVHLYPIIANEVYCGTLAESQASGLPAVINAAGGGADAARGRVRNGQTGYLAPDESAFVNLTHGILSAGSGIYRTLHREALALQRQRSWEGAAIEFEAVWR